MAPLFLSVVLWSAFLHLFLLSAHYFLSADRMYGTAKGYPPCWEDRYFRKSLVSFRSVGCLAPTPNRLYQARKLKCCMETFSLSYYYANCHLVAHLIKKIVQCHHSFPQSLQSWSLPHFQSGRIFLINKNIHNEPAL